MILTSSSDKLCTRYTWYERELDSEFERIATDLQTQGRATVGGFRQQLESIQGVSAVNILENQESTYDSSGRNPSIEVFVDGGSDDEVAQATTYKPLGIKMLARLLQVQSTKGQGQLLMLMVSRVLYFFLPLYRLQCL